MPEQPPCLDSPHAALCWVPPPCPPATGLPSAHPRPAAACSRPQVSTLRPSEVDRSHFTGPVSPGTRRFWACEAGGPSLGQGATGHPREPSGPPASSPQNHPHCSFRGHRGPVLNCPTKTGPGSVQFPGGPASPRADPHPPLPLRAFPERPAPTAQRAPVFPARTSQRAPALLLQPEEQSKREPQGLCGPCKWQADTQTWAPEAMPGGPRVKALGVKLKICTQCGQEARGP